MPASYVPNFMSELPAEMSFCERAFNLAWKLLGLSLMFFHCLRCDQNIARDATSSFLPNYLSVQEVIQSCVKTFLQSFRESPDSQNLAGLFLHYSVFVFLLANPK